MFRRTDIYVSLHTFLIIINNNIIGRHMVEEPISLFLRFGHGPILVQINLKHSQAQPYSEMQLVPFLKSLV